MAAKSTAPKPVPPRPAPRLYVETPVVTDAAAFAPQLARLVGGADVAAVLLRLAAAGNEMLLQRIKVLAPAVQEAGAALLLDGHADLVARARADGAHVAGEDALRAALSSLKPDHIVGAGGLATRHDAMVAGEAGVDYVLFGEPDAAGRRPAFDAIVERVAWWAEVFEPPCVGYAQSLDEVAAITRAGADFVLVGDLVWNDPRGAEAALMDVARLIGQVHAEASDEAEGTGSKQG